MNPLGAGAGAGATVSSTDGITLVAPNAPPGTSILLRIDAPLAATVDASPCGSAPFSANSLASTNLGVSNGNSFLAAAGASIGSCSLFRAGVAALIGVAHSRPATAHGRRASRGRSRRAPEGAARGDRS